MFDKLLIAKVCRKARIGLNSSFSFALFLVFTLALTAVWVHAQSKLAAPTITVYQDPG